MLLQTTPISCEHAAQWLAPKLWHGEKVWHRNVAQFNIPFCYSFCCVWDTCFLAIGSLRSLHGTIPLIKYLQPVNKTIPNIDILQDILTLSFAACTVGMWHSLLRTWCNTSGQTSFHWKLSLRAGIRLSCLWYGQRCCMFLLHACTVLHAWAQVLLHGWFNAKGLDVKLQNKALIHASVIFTLIPRNILHGAYCHGYSL